MARKNITRNKLPKPDVRQALLITRRNARMARSAHAYVRGNTSKFYEWLDGMESHALPEGPAIWICGDCHTGNLGPVADAEGRVEILIRDLDQTVIGNPAHDLIRLGLSLATAARGSNLPGLTTVHMMEALADGYERAFDEAAGDADIHAGKPEAVRVVMKEAVRRSWRHLAEERIEDLEPTIPLGPRFWPLAKRERREIEALFGKESLAELATVLRGGGEDADVEVLDAAYWVKGCSSLGRLRYAVLLDIDGAAVEGDDLCLIDIKEAAQAAAPRYPRVRMPRDNAERVVEGARHLSPSLGERMRAARLLDRAVVIRELLPQDMKLTIEQLTQDEAMKAARFLALVVGKAHARQMDSGERAAWLAELRRNRSKTLDAPGWLWKSILELVSSHAVGYLEHCRRYATEGVTK
ncbi:DUF2252 domain-containing protein [Paraburkholderia nemoris]|jgi:Uncharacterized protein conserved in bacteria|uniref:DUF2252 domain-containing protein n=1 Tax=Paraburkholderia nemoris TaxID=2793076 RepID=UPI0019116DB8|nr:DUF2252 domain-containing protein [Paraburkholderia nemoris]MBK5148997.1 DUF2252 domain-containing protein [Burkholderia sp. R-69608]CAE6838215.1 hypothetical protein LMG22931_07124 [Paraburkholderia nemoris]CAE6910418.1 hypothetical protein R69608_03484 [Paraburkholderia nemoris]